MDLITNLGQFLLSVAFLILIIVLHMLLLKASLQLVELWIEFHKLNLIIEESKLAMCPSLPQTRPLTVTPSPVHQISMRQPHISSSCSATSRPVRRSTFDSKHSSLIRSQRWMKQIAEGRRHGVLALLQLLVIAALLLAPVVHSRRVLFVRL